MEAQQGRASMILPVRLGSGRILLVAAAAALLLLGYALLLELLADHDSDELALSAAPDGGSHDAQHALSQHALSETAHPDRGSSSALAKLLVLGVVVISAAGGIGGGGVIVPVLMLTDGMSAHGAIPLSKLTIFGNAICQLLLNYRRRHPYVSDSLLIDYESTLMFEPPTLLGTVFGVLLNRMSPQWLINLLLLTFLSITAGRTAQRGVALYRRESAERAAIAYGRGKDAIVDPRTAAPAAAAGATAAAPVELQLPWKTLTILGLVWAHVLAASLVKRATVCGSVGYWVTPLVLALVVGAVTLQTGRRLRKEHTARVALGHVYAPGQIQWGQKQVEQYPLLCLGAGILAGSLGVGGGMVMQPLMLELGMLPEVASATAAFMMLFTASSTTAQFTLLGLVDWETNWPLVLIGAAGAYFGQRVIGRAMKASGGRQSLIVAPVALIIGLSALLMVYVSSTNAMGPRMTGHTLEGFHGPCN